MDGLQVRCKAMIIYLPCKMELISLRSSVVCPVSLISQWASEISRTAVGLRVIQYHGQSRTRDPSVLEQAHVVVTSYTIVAYEYATFTQRTGRSKDALFRVKWFRIVLGV